MSKTSAHYIPLLKSSGSKGYLSNPKSLWNSISTYVFKALGGQNFLFFRFNYIVVKRPVKSSNFHKQLLLCWLFEYKHNFSPHKYSIWNNQGYIFQMQIVVLNKWVDNGILLNCHRGHMFTYHEFLLKYNTPILPREFAIVFDAVTSGVKSLSDVAPRHIIHQTFLPEFYIGNSDPFLSIKIINV